MIIFNTTLIAYKRDELNNDTRVRKLWINSSKISLTAIHIKSNAKKKKIKKIKIFYKQMALSI